MVFGKCSIGNLNGNVRKCEVAAGAVKSKFTSLSSAAVLQILLDTADRSFNGYNPADHGMGILNVEAALNVNPVDYIGIN